MSEVDIAIRKLSQRNLQLMRAIRMCKWDNRFTEEQRQICIETLQTEWDANEELILELFDSKLTEPKDITDVSKAVADLLNF